MIKFVYRLKCTVRRSAARHKRIVARPNCTRAAEKCVSENIFGYLLFRALQSTSLPLTSSIPVRNTSRQKAGIVDFGKELHFDGINFRCRLAEAKAANDIRQFRRRSGARSEVHGEPSLLPRRKKRNNQTDIINSFQTNGHDCDLIQNAFKRYGDIISSMIPPAAQTASRSEDGPPVLVERAQWSDDPLFAGFLDEVTVSLANECEQRPTPNMVESCKPLVPICYHHQRD